MIRFDCGHDPDRLTGWTDRPHPRRRRPRPGPRRADRPRLLRHRLPTRSPGDAHEQPAHHPAPAPPRDRDTHARMLRRAAAPDHGRWLAHVASTRGCVRPVRLTGALHTVEQATGRIVATRHTTTDLPDGVIYVPCGDRRASVCPAVRGDLPGRHLPAHPRGARRRQRRPGHRHRASGRVRHPHRTLLRPRPHPNSEPADGEGAAVPDAPRHHPVPARPTARLHQTPR